MLLFCYAPYTAQGETAARVSAAFRVSAFASVLQAASKTQSPYASTAAFHALESVVRWLLMEFGPWLRLDLAQFVPRGIEFEP